MRIRNELLTSASSIAAQLKKMEENSALRNITHSLNVTNSLSEQMRNFDSSSRLRELTRSLTAANLVYEQFRSVNIEKQWAEMVRSVTTTITLSEQLKKIDIHSQWKEMANSFSTSIALLQQLKNVDVGRQWREMTQSFNASSAISDQLRNISENDSWRKLFDTVSIGSSYSKYLKDFSNTTSLQKLAISVGSSNQFTSSLERLRSSEYFDLLLDNFEEEKSETRKIENTEINSLDSKNIDTLLREIGAAETSQEFSKLLKKTPGIFKFFLIFIFMNLIFPILPGVTSGIMGNLLTPYVTLHLNNAKDASQREKIKIIKKISFPELAIELKDYRFITKKVLLIRETPSSTSAIVGHLKFGQVIGVLSKDRDWTKVIYEYGDGTTITGWVFTRYTEKFRS
ncbi:SH3 domain-containing protein [Janthinobacterium sp. YR213]|uniref:SH3 domain-containing protein n=1 Tax=Janthinobacterium sp. YR213 TaxID=1881027 RepID=UPI0008838C55|nr:SH3 domain-containing protein [Janthinobacterium sp. YR213]SDG70309.1 SH3 domain-containing protein [Janthinobacterium sp. YR213]